MLGRNEDAIADYSRAIDLELTSAALYMGRASILADSDNPSTALGDFKKAQTLIAPDDPRQEQLQKTN